MILNNPNIKQLLIKLSLPAVVGMLVMALYNVVDAIFIGRGVGTIGIAGVAINFPIQMIIGAIGQLAGVGGASVLSRSLGAKDFNKANQILGNVLITITGMSLVIIVIGYVFMNDLLRLFGASETILPYAREYLMYVLGGSGIHCMAMALNNLVRAEGKAKIAMITMIASAVVNIILDAVFILGFKMGIRGAAIATLIAYITGGSFLLFYYLSGRSILQLRLQNIRFNLGIQREIFAIGVSVFVQQTSMSLLMMILNNTLGKYGGDLSIAVYGVIMRLLMLIITPLLGLAQGLQPIAGYNYGAQNFTRTREVFKLAALYATFFASFGALMLFAFPHVFLRLFSSDEALIAQGRSALRLMIPAFPVVGFQIMGTTLFRAIGKASQTFVLTLSRQILFLLPLVFILPLFFQARGIWISFPIADTLSTLLTFVMLYKLQKQFQFKDQAMPEPDYAT